MTSSALVNRVKYWLRAQQAAATVQNSVEVATNVLVTLRWPKLLESFCRRREASEKVATPSIFAARKLN
jgi:hypothetical protein